MKLHLSALSCCAVLLLGWSQARAHPSASEPVQIQINASFDHSSQSGAFQTLLSLVGSWTFESDSPGRMTARLEAPPGTCFAIASWGLPAQPPTLLGPAILCLAAASIGPEELNLWLERGKRSRIDPSLSILLVPGYDIYRLLGVTFRDNGTAIDAVSFAVGGPSDPSP